MFLLIAACSVLTFLLQYTYRSLDDNRLTSWEAAFKFADFRHVLAALCVGMLVAWPLSRVLFPRRYRSVILFVLSFGLCMPFWSEPEMIVDAARYFTQAKYLELHGPVFFLKEWGRQIFAWTDTPVVSFLYGLIFRYLGETRVYIQIFTTACFSLTVLLTYRLGSRLWDEETGYIGALLLLGIPFLYSQAPLMMVDVPLMFFLMVSVYTFLLALERGGGMILLSALAIATTFYVKYSSFLMLTVLPVLFCVVLLSGHTLQVIGTGPGGRPRTILARGLAVFLLSSVLAGIFFLPDHEVFMAQIRLLREYQEPGLKRWGESFLSTFLFQTHPFITLAAVSSLWLAIRRLDARYLVPFWLLLLVAVLQIRRSRYIIMVFPMLTVMASLGLMQLRRAEVRRFLVSCVVASSLVVAVFAFRPFLNNISEVNLRDAGSFLDTLRGDEAEVFTVYARNPEANPAVAVPLLDLFTGKRLLYNETGVFDARPEEIKTSSLRFTWEYPNPPFYAGKGAAKERKPALVVITDQGEEAVPPAIREKIGKYGRSRIFDKEDHEFAFKTLVRVYY